MLEASCCCSTGADSGWKSITNKARHPWRREPLHGKGWGCQGLARSGLTHVGSWTPAQPGCVGLRRKGAAVGAPQILLPSTLCPPAAPPLHTVSLGLWCPSLAGLSLSPSRKDSGEEAPWAAAATVRARKEGSETPCCKICLSLCSFESNLRRCCNTATGNKSFKACVKGKQVFSRKEVLPLYYLPVLQQETFLEPPGTQGRLFALCLVHRQTCQLPY